MHRQPWKRSHWIAQVAIRQLIDDGTDSAAAILYAPPTEQGRPDATMLRGGVLAEIGLGTRDDRVC